MATVNGNCHPSFGPVKEVFQKHLDEGSALGHSVCLVVNGETLVDLYGGHSDAAKTKPWADNTLVNVWSTTKAWTGLCVLKLIEDGHLKLDAKISDYWPEFAQGGKGAATVKHALTHGTGAQTLRGMLKPMDPQIFEWDTMCAKIAAEPALWEPGSQYAYHAWTYGHINGELVRRADPKHRTVGQFWKEEFATPLGIPDIYIGLPDALHSRAAELIPGPGIPEGYPEKVLKKALHNGGENVMITTMLNPPRHCAVANTPEWRRAEMPASGGVTDARSMATLYHALQKQLAGRPVQPAVPIKTETLRLATEEHAKLFGNQPQGLGFQLKLMGNKRAPYAFGHPGLGGNQAFGDPEEDLGFGYVRNRCIGAGQGGERDYAKELADACYDCLQGYRAQLAGNGAGGSAPAAKL